MTLKELQAKYPGATEDTWHRHTNGGGWVKNTAIVHDSAWVSDNACMSGDARVSGNACVSGDAWEWSPLYIQGSMHCLCQPTLQTIKIGCVEMPLAEWLKTYEAVGVTHGYTSEQIAEYGLYLRVCADLEVLRKGRLAL